MGTPSWDPVVGDRIVVRYRLGDDAPRDWRGAPNPPVAGDALSDVTGILVSATADALIIERDCQELSLPRSAITSVRTLSRRVVRNSAIRNLERVLAMAWPGGDHAEIDGWLVAAGSGDVRRANSAKAVEFGVTAAGAAAATRWLTARGATPDAMVAERLLRPDELAGMVIGRGEVLVGDPRELRLPTPSFRMRAATAADSVDLREAAGPVGIADTPAGRVRATTVTDRSRTYLVVHLSPASASADPAPLLAAAIAWAAHSDVIVVTADSADPAIRSRLRAVGLGLHHTVTAVRLADATVDNDVSLN